MLLNRFILFRSSKYGIITGCLRFGIVKVAFWTATAQEWHTFERASIVPGQVGQGMRGLISASYSVDARCARIRTIGTCKGDIP